ncbi:MAG: Cys-tRNA(Pro) deacylase [Clostridia bacterium]|nr:Cys-tRNA(Pro) deacylase [Clostridia bacterium]
MKKQQEEKTNALRLLDAQGVPHSVHTYDPDAADGGQVAALLGESPDQVFKTLVTVAPSRKNYVFVVPVNCTLNLKKAAAAVGEKSIAMIPQKDLLPLTGYIHGGCSPIGMKKLFPTYIHETAQLFDTVFVSAGRRGCQVELNPDTLCALVQAAYADLAD